MAIIRIVCVHANLYGNYMYLVDVVQYYRQRLEDVEEFGGLHDHFETFTLYRGKKSLDDEDDDARRMAGYFKVDP